MNIPLNGRIAIIDDQIAHAEPIMKILSKHQLPFTYFSGEVQFLPDHGENLNDVRILFLDINLIDNSEHSDKEIKSTLLPVLDRVISVENYPYIVIYWSRQEHHRKLIEGNIFNQELNDRKPIAFLSASKTDYINLDGTVHEDTEEKIETLIQTISTIIQNLPAYSYLLNWENQIHVSADKVLQGIFDTYDENTWENNANFILTKLGKAYLGSHFDEISFEDRIKGSYNTLSITLLDSLQKKIHTTPIEHPIELNFNQDEGIQNNLYNINTQLLISDEIEPVNYSGTIVLDSSEDETEELDVFLKKILRKHKEKDAILASCKKIWLNVTPLCDAVQGNIVFNRLIKGLLVLENFSKSFYNNEAIYVSPKFSFDNEYLIIVLDFRYFFTEIEMGKIENITPIFRIRQQLLAEIQSRLARHINRQGILFLDDRG